MGGVSKSRVRCARVGIAVCSHLVFLTMVVLGLVILFWYRYGTPPTTVPLSPAPGVFADLRADNLSDAASYIWVQASDIHVRGPTAPSTQAFREFCSDVLPHLDPAYVIVTGDIHDGNDNGRATQIRSQWALYDEIRRGCGVNTTWVEVLGNHDVHRATPADMANQVAFTASGPAVAQRVRVVELHSPRVPAGAVPGDKLVLLNTNADEEPVMNFYAATNSSFARAVRTELRRLAAEGRPAVTVGHHPLAMMAQSYMARPFLREVRHGDGGDGGGSTVPYDMHVSGHVHGVRKHRHNSGVLDVAATTLQARAYRVWACDNHLLSFRDVTFDEWPVAFVTYPKPARLLMAGEPNHLMRGARELRAVVVARSNVTRVQAAVDGTTVCASMAPVAGTPFYRCAWDSAPYAAGVHTVVLHVTDAEGTSTWSDTFSLDGTIGAPFRDLLIGRDLGTLMMGGTLFFELFMAVLVFVPKIVQLVHQRGRSHEHDRAPCFGPVAAAWTSAIDSKQGTVEDYLADESLSKCQHVGQIATWELQSAINLYGTMNTKLWVYCAVVLVYTAFLPAGVNVDNNDFVWIFNWGVVKRNFRAFELATGGLALFFRVFVFFPTFSLLARWSSPTSARKQRRGITVYEGFLYVLEVVFSVVCLVLLALVLVLPSALFAAPLLWIIVVNNALLLYELIVPCCKPASSADPVEMS